MKTKPLVLCLVLLVLSAGPFAANVQPAQRSDVTGAKVSLVGDQDGDHQDLAAVSVVALGKHALRIDVAPSSRQTPRTLKVELPSSGRNTWPAADVEVLDANGHAVPAEHNGIEWHRFVISVGPAGGHFTVHAADAPKSRLVVYRESMRHVTESATGVSATICNWYDGRRAALAIRFDDSHPTHLTKAIPILREYGFRATFMINPGVHDGRSSNSRWRSAFQEHRAEWEAVARRGDQEFGNHTARHRGASSDEEMECEIGDATKVIWELFPDKSKLVALNLGGGTQWTTTKTLRYYLDRYHLFEVSGSLGMDDVHGNRVAVFRQHLERNMAPGSLGWCKIHFHSIGDGLASSEDHLREVLGVVKQHEADVWVAGLADTYKYLVERRAAKLTVANDGPNRVRLGIQCATDITLFDQPLTIDLALPQAWANRNVVVRDVAGNPIESQRVSGTRNVLIRFHVQPIDAEYTIE